LQRPDFQSAYRSWKRRRRALRLRCAERSSRQQPAHFADRRKVLLLSDSKHNRGGERSPPLFYSRLRISELFSNDLKFGSRNFAAISPSVTSMSRTRSLSPQKPFWGPR